MSITFIAILASIACGSFMLGWWLHDYLYISEEEGKEIQDERI